MNWVHRLSFFFAWHDCLLSCHRWCSIGPHYQYLPHGSSPFSLNICHCAWGCFILSLMHGAWASAPFTQHDPIGPCSNLPCAHPLCKLLFLIEASYLQEHSFLFDKISYTVEHMISHSSPCKEYSRTCKWKNESARGKESNGNCHLSLHQDCHFAGLINGSHEGKPTTIFGNKVYHLRALCVLGTKMV